MESVLSHHLWLLISVDQAPVPSSLHIVLLCVQANTPTSPREELGANTISLMQEHVRNLALVPRYALLSNSIDSSLFG